MSILIVCEVVNPEKDFANLIVRLPGVGGLVALLPKYSKHMGLEFEIKTLVAHYRQSRYR